MYFSPEAVLDIAGLYYNVGGLLTLLTYCCCYYYYYYYYYLPDASVISDVEYFSVSVSVSVKPLTFYSVHPFFS